MGYLCEVYCPGCGYKQVFPLGCGRKDYNLKRIYSHFDLMDLWSVKVMALEKRSDFLTFRYRLGKCKDCGQLQAVPEVLFTDGTTFHGRTCICDEKKEHEITLYPEKEQIKLKCPKCGKKIVARENGLWD